jgi:hypothetical protein
MSDISDEAPKVVSIPPNKSTLWLDSRNRQRSSDFPCDFGTYLSSGIVAKELIYKNLYWSSPLFTHNLLSNEIRFQVQGNDSPNGDNEVFVCYIRPWTIFKQFDGNVIGGGGFNPPQTGSYAKEVEVALGDSRLLSTNFVPYTISVGGQNILFSCLYNPSVGFLISCKNVVTQAPINWRFTDCNWIVESFNVHGFGIYDSISGVMRPKYYDESNVFYQAYISDGIPNLTTSKYLIVYSPELTRERRLPSFKNYTDSSGQGVDTYTNEIATLPVLLDNVGKYALNSITDGTVVSVRNGSQTQYLRIFMQDNANRRMYSGNPMGVFLGDETIPPNVIATAFDPLQNYRSPIMMDYLLFGIHNPNNPIIINTNMFQAGAAANLHNLVGYATPAFNPTLRQSTPPTNDMTGPWIVMGDHTYSKNDARPSEFTFNVQGDILLSNINAGALASVIMVWYQNGGGTPYLEYKSLVTFPVDSTQAGNTFSITDTAPSYFLNQVNVGDHYNVKVEIYMVSSPTPDGTQTAYISTSSLSSYSIRTANTVRTTYLNPALDNRWGKAYLMCLDDDLTHEIDVVF